MKEWGKIKQLLKESNSLSPHILTLQIAQAIVTSSANILQVFMVAFEVQTLLAGEIIQALTVGIFFLVGQFLINLVSNCLSEATDRQSRLLNFRAQTEISKHLVEVDYETFMDANFRQLYSDIESGFQFTGGFQAFIQNVVKDFTSFIVTLFTSGSVVMLVLVKCWQQLTQPFEKFWLVLGLALAVILPLFVSSKAGKLSGKIFQQFFEVNTKFNRLLSYYFDYAFKDISINKLLRLFDPTNSYLNKAEEQVIAGVSIDKKIQNKALSVYLFSDLLTNLIIGLMYVVFGLFILRSKALNIASLIAAVGTLQLLIASLGRLFSSWGNRMASFKTMEQYHKFMSMGIIKTGLTKTKPLITGQYFEIEFDHVSYCYPGQERPALNDVCLTFKSNTRTALVGPNGSGKTTLVKLLLRLIKPTSGKILLNGQNINKILLDDYQHFFAVVSQHFFLGADSLADVLSVGVKKDKAKAVSALVEAGLKERLEQLPLGIETSVSNTLNANGVNFSGGEQQKIAIARAVYRDSQFYVLDEPTAALDPISEAEVFDQFDLLTHGKTALFISHRMSSTRASDQIYVLKQGKVLESGQHQSLMAKHGLYYKMYSAQAKFFIKKEKLQTK